MSETPRQTRRIARCGYFTGRVDPSYTDGIPDAQIGAQRFEGA